MREQIQLLLRRIILWACPEIARTSLTAGPLDDFVNAAKLIASNDLRGEDASGLGAPTSPPGGHASHAPAQRVGGAHVWVLAALALGSLFIPTRIWAQQGGQTSSVPPLTGTGAPSGNCGVGSLYVNTTTGDLYDCNGGSWLKVNGGGSGAFSGGLGASFQDATEIAAPANPASGNDRLWVDSTSHLLACHTSSGASCLPSGGAGTVTQVMSGNFSPLFNVSVATNTTTPAFSFAGISQSQNLFFASPNGSSGVGAFRAMVAADVPASANSCTTHQFTISLASGLSVTCAQPVAADIGSIPGSSGQLLFNNAGQIGAEDPIVSYAYVNLWTTQDVTTTRTSSVVRVSTFGQYGELIATWAGITGSPSGCTIQLKAADSVGNTTNNGSAVAVAPANGTSAILFTPSIYTAAQMGAVFNCSAYPSAGILTLDFVPSITVYSQQGVAGAQSSPWWVRPTDGANNMPMADAAARAHHVTPGDGTSDMGAMANFGTSPGAVKSLNANASCFVGTTACPNDGTAGVQAVGGHLGDNGSAATTNRAPVLPCIYQTDYANGTAATQGRDGASECGTDGLTWTANLPAIRPASFHTSANFAASSTTDNFVFPGNASNTVLITSVKVSCTQTTAGIVLMKVIKRSAADTSGTSAAVTPVPDDSNYSAAVSAPLSYTGTGPTVGTAVGTVDEYYLGCLAAGTASPNDIYILNLRQKPIVLRGTAQQLAINFGGALTGGNLNVTVDHIETKTITP